MATKITSIGGKEFLEVETLNDSRGHNPFSINIKQIRYMREWTDDKEKDVWAFFIGDKMLKIKACFGIQDALPGDIVMIGTYEFLCVSGSSLTDKNHGRYLINFENVLYFRKFIPEEDAKKSTDKAAQDIKNDITNPEQAENFNIFAIITVDNRTIPISFGKKSHEIDKLSNVERK